MRRVSFLIISLGLVLILVSCGGSSGVEPGGDAAALGEEIYRTGGSSGIPCAACHTLDGTELVGPSFQGIAKRAATQVEGQSTEQYLRKSIVSPSAYIVDGYPDPMTATYGQTLSEEEIDSLIAFLLTLD